MLPIEENIQMAVKYLKNGELIGLPTETVYGLAANALNGKAVRKIFEVKGRPQDNPLIVHICSLDMLYPLVSEVPETALNLAKAYWPGPLTIVLPKSNIIPEEITAGLETVAVRYPAHDVAQKVIKQAGFPLAAPSANLSGKPSPTTAKHVFEDLEGKIPLILDGGRCDVGVESTVISIVGDEVNLLRPGAITPNMLKKHCKKLKIANAVLNMLEKGESAQSPGMKYKHYSPNANVIILNGTLSDFKEYVKRNKTDYTYALVFNGESKGFDVKTLTYGSDSNEQARELFSALRQLDDIGAKTVYVRCPDKTGMGFAVYNRLIRAAGFKEINL